MTDLFTQSRQENLTLVPDTFFGDEFLSTQLRVKDLVRQLNWILTQRKIDYLNLVIALKNHKSIQIRRKVANLILTLGNPEFLPELRNWQKNESDRQTWLVLESAIEKFSRGVAIENIENPAKILSVSEAIGQIKRLIGQEVYVVEGELSEVKFVRQMCFFGLKDVQDSRLDCMCFAGRLTRLGFPLNEGLSVRITGQFKLSKFSKVYLEVQKIALTGEGALLKNLKILEEKLAQEGLFEQSRKRTISKIPENILLLASSSSAAILDFTKVLERRIGGRNIYHLSIKTQGIGAEFELLQNLQLANEIVEKYKIDTIVLTRGGGSKDDLFIFNSEKVVRAVHALKRPTIVAVGHEKDVSLAELAADLRASTPSQAAELVCQSKIEIKAEIEKTVYFLTSFFGKHKDRINLLISVSTQSILHNLSTRILQTRKQSQEIDRILNKTILNIRHQNEILISNLLNIVQNKKNYFQRSLTDISRVNNKIKFQIFITRNSAKNALEVVRNQVILSAEKFKSEFNLTVQQIELTNPKKILQKGYTLIRQKEQLIKRKKKLDLNNDFTIEFADGVLKIDK